MNPGRRVALRVLAGASAGAAASAATPALAKPKATPLPEARGMLYDTTRCIGCKACVTACQQANGLAPDNRLDPLYLAPVDLNSRTKNVVKLAKVGDRTSFVKAQCMHCVDPACTAACMLGSLHKDATTGVVSYDPSYCVGCRYCQMACPFNVPKFEYEKAAPKVVKCELCRHRPEGPACVEVCPRGAVIAGRRDELLAEAKRRIASAPGRYFENRVYGETDGGGTQVLYLSHLPFAAIGLPDFEAWGLADGESVPTRMQTVQHGLYRGFVAPVVLYAALAVAVWRNRASGQEGDHS